MSITYHVCKYTPTELLTALGGQCALLDEAPENFDLSDQVAHPNLCGFGKSVIQAALAGQVKELVLVNCCDTIRSAYDILKEFGNLDFLYLLDILHSQEGCSVQHARDQLLALAEAYGAYKGTQFDRAAFFAAFQSPPPVTGPHIAVLGAKMGSHLFSLVEETMPLPVENATCANNRRVAPPADQGDFAALMEDYARCLLGQLPCMRMTDNTARRALYNTPGLEGVVDHTLQFCDYYGFEYAGLRHQLPVPLLKIESDGTTQSREQLRTRLEAFAEGFGPQKGDPTMKKHGYFAGIDSGSATTDVVILDQDRTIVAKVILPTGAGASNGAQRALDQALQQAGLTQADLTATVTTGYGRGVIQTGDKSVTEITCHAKGAHFLHPAVRTVIDIGGFTRITEDTISDVVRLSGLGIHDWAARKEYSADNRPYLHLYLEIASGSLEVMAVSKQLLREHLSVYFKYFDNDYNDLKKMLGIEPLQITILRTGTFDAFRRATGQEVRRINESSFRISELLRFQERDYPLERGVVTP